jgi:hypothetical protein
MYLVLAETSKKIVLLLDEVLDLVGQCDIGQIEPAVLVVVTVFLSIVAEWGKDYSWKSLSNS